MQATLLRMRRVGGDDARQALADVRAAVRAVDPDLLPSLSEIAMEAGPLWFQKVQAQACAGFAAALAALALLLTGAGIYRVKVSLARPRSPGIWNPRAPGARGSRASRGAVV